MNRILLVARWLMLVAGLTVGVLTARAREHLDALHVGNVTYSNVTIIDVSDADIYFQSVKGMATAKWTELDPELRKHFWPPLTTPEEPFVEYNCALRLPDGYQPFNLPPPPNVTVVAASLNNAKTRAVCILATAAIYTVGSIDDTTVGEIERGLQAGGAGDQVSGRYVEIGGIKSYEGVGMVMIRGRRISTVVQMVPADGRIYCLLGMRFDGDASNDPEVREILDGFHFLHPPVPPAAPVELVTPGTKAVALQVVGALGKLGMLAVVGFGIILIVVLLVVFIVRQNRD